MQILRWSTETKFYDTPKGPSGCVKFGNRIYIFSSTNNKNKIYTMDIHPDDTLSVWKSVVMEKHLDYRSATFQLIGNAIYMVGALVNELPTTSIYYCLIYNNGTLSNWRTVRNKRLPYPITACSLAYLNKNLYVIGGKITDDDISNKIIKLEMDEYNKIKNVSECAYTLPEHICDTSVISYNDSIFLIGGRTGQYSTSRVLRLYIANDQFVSTDLKPLPSALTKPGVCILGEKLYVIGYNTDGRLLSKTYIGIINRNGLVSRWYEDLPFGFEIDDLCTINTNTSFLVICGIVPTTNERLVLHPVFTDNKDNISEFIDIRTRDSIKKQINYLNIAIVVLIITIVVIFGYFQSKF